MKQATCITNEARKRGAARGGETRRKMHKAGRGSGLSSVGRSLMLDDQRECVKCGLKMTLRQMIAHRLECQAIGIRWFEMLPEAKGNFERMAAMLLRKEEMAND